EADGEPGELLSGLLAHDHLAPAALEAPPGHDLEFVADRKQGSSVLEMQRTRIVLISSPRELMLSAFHPEMAAAGPRLYNSSKHGVRSHEGRRRPTMSAKEAGI